MTRKTPLYVHGMGFVVMASSMVFSYAVLIENGMLPGLVGFAFGMMFLLLLYGHQLDEFYCHIGDKFKIGGQSYDPKRESVQVEFEDDERAR